ncbi:MAG: hypothetical protein ABIJ42_04300 [Acidobacteriota bacterium]
MKYSNQINMFLAITGCIVVLWVFSQTYLQPSPDEQLDTAGIVENAEEPPSSQPPAVYQGDSSTNANPVAYGAPSRRSASPSTPLVNGAAAGGGSLGSGTQGTRNPSGGNSTGISGFRAPQSASPGRASSSDPGNIPGVESPSSQGSSAARPTNVGGFSTPPAGQAQGMEQAKRTPADSSSDRNYVPFRSSMANRPN